MNVFADVVHQHIPNAYFICLRRDPPFLAQSLLAARREIRGSVSKGYGVENVEQSSRSLTDPIEEVCHQIKFLDDEARRMQSTIGEDHFWIVDYEAFCDSPRALIEKIHREILRVEPDESQMTKISRLTTTNEVKDTEQMKAIVRCLEDTNLEFKSPL